MSDFSGGFCVQSRDLGWFDSQVSSVHPTWVESHNGGVWSFNVTEDEYRRGTLISDWNYASTVITVCPCPGAL